jgi:Cd2+/Zn2+-exporting ATPase
MNKTRLDLAALLPEHDAHRDACVDRLQLLLTNVAGVENVHIVDHGADRPAEICLHFDPAVLSLADVERHARLAGAKLSRLFGHVVLRVRAIGGEDVSRRIEKVLLASSGITSASMNLASQSLRVEFEREQTSVEQISSIVNGLGFAVEAVEKPKPVAGSPEAKEKSLLVRHRELALSLASGVILVLAFLLERFAGLPRTAAVGLYLVSYGFGGFDLVSHSVKAIRKGRFAFDIDLLMLLAAVGAAFLGEFAEGAFLLFLFSLAHALEHYALGQARQAIRALSDLSPPMARVTAGGVETEVPIEAVRVGDIVVVRPGERIPIDGRVRSGRSAVNQAPVTGESIPVEKDVGGDVFAGTVNGEGSLEIETTRAIGDRTLDRVVKLVEEAQTQKAPTQEFTDRFERIFVPTVLVIDVLLIVLPPLFGWWTWGLAFYRGMSLLVAASPCALALGTPSAVLAAIAQAARNGVLIKGGAHLENFGTIRAIAFDKTGTLTVGRPEVVDVVTVEGADRSKLLRIAAAVERRSQHPLAQAVLRRAELEKIDLPESADLESVTAKGVRSTVEGRVVEIGSLKLWDDVVPASVTSAVDALKSAGRSIVVVKYGGKFLGVLGLADEPRANAAEVLNSLRRQGIERLVMLTGDHRGVGEAVGKTVGVDEVKADLMPESKVDAVRELLARYGGVAMIGDGVNDAPALATATVGVAMGGSGTAVALETADVALMGDDLAKLPFALKLSRAARRVIVQNVFIALGVIGFLVLTATTGLLGMGWTVVIHEGSTLVVIANALRLLGVKDDGVHSSNG